MARPRLVSKLYSNTLARWEIHGKAIYACLHHSWQCHTIHPIPFTQHKHHILRSCIGQESSPEDTLSAQDLSSPFMFSLARQSQSILDHRVKHIDETDETLYEKYKQCSWKRTLACSITSCCTHQMHNSPFDCTVSTVRYFASRLGQCDRTSQVGELSTEFRRDKGQRIDRGRDDTIQVAWNLTGS